LIIGMCMALLAKGVLAVNNTITGENPFVYGQCPTDLFSFIMYFGMGGFILLILWLSKRLIRVPFITIFVGIGFVIWSAMGLWGCSTMFGFLGIMFGMGVIVYEFITTVIK